MPCRYRQPRSHASVRAGVGSLSATGKTVPDYAFGPKWYAGDLAERKPVIDAQVERQLREKLQVLQDAGELDSLEGVREQRARFIELFGPTVLKSVDGEALLRRMHDNLSRDSMVYWLEYKNDEQFHAQSFGGIGGRSALKFRFYHRKEDEKWVTGTNTDQREMDLSAAIDMARQHRDQILAIVSLLEAFPEGASDEASDQLQSDIEKAAPDLCRSAFVHKYISIVFPSKLDDFHSTEWQQFHLKKLLQLPPEREGLYAPAGIFARLAIHLGWPIHRFTEVCNARHGRPHRYWRVGTSDGSRSRNWWPLMRDGGVIAIGWPALGDLSGARPEMAAKEKLRALLTERYPNTPQYIGKAAKEILDFAATTQPGDLVIACEGETAIAVGRVTGSYQFATDGQPDCPHRIPVTWLDVGDWAIPNPSGLLQRTFVPADKHPANVVAIERRILGAISPLAPAPATKPTGPMASLAGWPAHIALVLERKKQVIVYGPPGTGKTYWAEETARELAARKAYRRAWSHLLPEEQKRVFDPTGATRSLVRMCCFHPGYGYEDFLEGYRPETVNGQLTFVQRDGVFKRLCQDAAAQPDVDFFLIVDEINRGDLPRIFGELLMVIETSKRGRPVTLAMSGQPFVVPTNVYLIGTMNTADRSIALLDKALRRRFGFVELLPEETALKDATVKSLPIWAWLESLNRRLCEHLGRDARNLQIGHAYFLVDGKPVLDPETFRRILREDVLPLLEDYCYDDWPTLEKILGKGLVDGTGQRFREGPLAEGNFDELFSALVAADPGIATSRRAVSAEAEPEVDGDDDDTNTSPTTASA
jgi:5-methylcytosine-specific restriction enzyme B